MNGGTKAELQENMLHWEKRLQHLSGDQIAAGLEAWEGRFPPKAKEFAAHCKEVTAPAKAMHRAHSCLSLPRPQPDKDKARASLREMKSGLRT